MRILVTGANGQLGSELRAIESKFSHDIIFVTSYECDITKAIDIDSVVQQNAIEAIINCAAYTAVDIAEEEVEKAYAVNALGVQNLVFAAEKYRIPLVHISTDYVFDGESTEPYQVTDVTNPKGIYGLSKRAGEEHIINSEAECIIIRTSWVFSSYGNNFVKTMLRLGASKSEINVVSDQFGCPTYAKDLAETCLKVLDSDSPIDKHGKIYHFSNAGVTNWAQFAKEIFSYSDLSCMVHEIPSSSYPTRAIRPKYSVLDSQKIQKDFDIQPRHWKHALQECLQLISQDSNHNQ